jgi:hypothetical protein
LISCASFKPPQESSESSPESVREASELDPLPLLLLRRLSRFFWCRFLFLLRLRLASEPELLSLASLLLRFRFFCFLFRLFLLRPRFSFPLPSGAPAPCSLKLKQSSIFGVKMYLIKYAAYRGASAMLTKIKVVVSLAVKM